MSRPTFLTLAALAALPSLSAQSVGAGPASTTPVTVGQSAPATTDKASNEVGDFLSQAGQIAKDAVSVDTVQVQEGGVVTKTTETAPEAAASKLSGLLRTRQALPGGGQVTTQHNASTLQAAATDLVQPPFTHTRQQGRTTVTEKSYLPVPLPTDLLSETEQHSGGVTTTTSAAGRVQNLRQFYYTKKSLPGGVETYGPPEVLPDSNTFTPLTKVTEPLPGGGTVTRDRAYVSSLKNLSSLGYTTTSTENGVTIQKFHSLSAPLSMDWAKQSAAADGLASSQAAVTKTAGSVWNRLNPLGWGRSLAATTKSALSQGAAAVPSAPGPTNWNPKGSFSANRNNVMRPGG